MGLYAFDKDINKDILIESGKNNGHSALIRD